MSIGKSKIPVPAFGVVPQSCLVPVFGFPLVGFSLDGCLDIGSTRILGKGPIILLRLLDGYQVIWFPVLGLLLVGFRPSSSRLRTTCPLPIRLCKIVLFRRLIVMTLILKS